MSDSCLQARPRLLQPASSPLSLCSSSGPSFTLLFEAPLFKLGASACPNPSGNDWGTSFPLSSLFELLSCIRLFKCHSLRWLPYRPFIFIHWSCVSTHREYHTLLAAVILFVLFLCTCLATINLHLHRKKLLPFGIAEPLCLHFRALVKCYSGTGTGTLVADMDSTGLMGDSILSRVGWRDSDL